MKKFWDVKESIMSIYLVNITFHTEEKSETRIIEIGVTNKTISETQMNAIFEAVNEMLSAPDKAASDLPFSYKKDGLNIDTLIKGVNFFVDGIFGVVKSNCGEIAIDNYYIIEQNYKT